MKLGLCTTLGLVCAVAVIALAPPARAVTETCLTGTAPDVMNDASQIRGVRALVDTACPCSSFDGSHGHMHRDYVNCAARIISAQIDAAALRPKCKATMKKYYARSTCGRDPNRHAVPCIQTSLGNGKVTCTIKSSTKQDGVTATSACSDTGKSRRVSCPTYSRCSDAADSNGDLMIAAPGDDGICVPSSGIRTIDGCRSLGVGSEACSYTFAWDPARCADRACKRLVIYFSGGQETCPDVTNPNSYLAHFTAQGYVAVCARAFETSTGSAQFPRHLEALRFDALVRAITSDPAVLAGWNGAYLLFSGVSHGASGPVVTMATQVVDDQSNWHGSAYTGACFFDGTYDVANLLDFEFTNQCTVAGAVVSYQRTYSRYCAWPPNADGNLPATWPAPSSCSTADTAADTLNSVTVGDFAIHDWKLIECGSALAPCTQDVLPAASIQSLCARIAATAGYTCAGDSFPTSSHILCGIDSNTIGACSSWFEAELSAHGLN